jgi:preprotein translocase subunit SecG
MTTVLLVIHLLLAIALIITVLIQRSEGGGLGIGGGGSGGTSDLMTSRGTANMLTRTTAILAGLFMLTSIVLAILASSGTRSSSVVEPEPAPIEAPAMDAPDAAPSVPLGE